MSEVVPGPLPQPQAPQPPSRRAPVAVVTAVIGVVVGALGVAVPWLLTGTGGNGIGGSTASLSAPSTLGDLASFQQASAHFGKQAGTIAQQHAADDVQSGKLLSAAYGGAGALVKEYSDDQLNDMASLFVVRADSPQPYTPYENTKELGVAVPLNEVEQFGAVNCLVQNEAVGPSGPPPTEDVFTSYCQRSSPDLTVQVRVSGDISHHPDQVAALVDDAWFNVH